MKKRILIPTILMTIIFACKREDIKQDDSLSISSFNSYIQWKSFHCNDQIPHENEIVNIHGYMNTNDFLELGKEITFLKNDLHILFPTVLSVNIASRPGLRDSIQEIVKDDQIRHNYFVVLKGKISSWDYQSPYIDECNKSVFILIDHSQDIHATKLD
jgi:hypothetical protein